MLVDMVREIAAAVGFEDYYTLTFEGHVHVIVEDDYDDECLDLFEERLEEAADEVERDYQEYYYFGDQYVWVEMPDADD